MRHNRIIRRVINCAGDIMADELVADNHAIIMYPLLLEGVREYIKKGEIGSVP